MPKINLDDCAKKKYVVNPVFDAFVSFVSIVVVTLFCSFLKPKIIDHSLFYLC